MNYRRRANAVLGTVFVIFILAAGLKHYGPMHQGISFFYFVSEAALVGGIADWFAVTALFRKPLGWPYHTALIPRNRDKMIEGITGMVQDELLSETLLRKKIEGLNLTQGLIRFIEKSGGADLLAEKLGAYLIRSFEKLSQEDAAKNIALKGEQWLKEKVIDTGISKRALAGARTLLDKEEFEHWLDDRIDQLLELAAQPKIKDKLLQSLGLIQQEQAAGGGMLQRTLLGLFQVTDGINLDEAAESLQVELILHLRELQQPNHPLRGRLKAVLREKLYSLEKDPDALNTLELWKNSYVAEANLEALLQPILSQALESLGKGKLPSGESLTDVLKPILDSWWSRVKEDTELHTLMDELSRKLLIQILQTEHTVIGQIVRETLEGLNDEEMNQFIEDKAGNDLQWIRINGSLVGGVVGAILFVLLNYGYTPLLRLLG